MDMITMLNWLEWKREVEKRIEQLEELKRLIASNHNH